MSKQIQYPMRIMRIIARMNVGGPAVQVSGLMRGMNTTRFDQRLYTGFCGPNEADYLELVASDVKCTRIQGFGRHINLISDIRAFFGLVKHIREFQPDLIHTHTAKAGFLGRLASILSLHPSIRVHTFHGHLLNGYFGRFRGSLIVVAERILGLFSDQLLSVGEKVQQDLIDAGIGSRDKFKLMPPGLTLGKLPDKNLSRVSLGLSNHELQCAFVGRITHIKRPDRFLDVVTELKSRGVLMHFLMAGDGELIENCRDRVAQEDLPVTILGWQGDIERVMSVADIVLLTSDNEGMPLSLIQAGMAGIPVVATNVGSVPEVVLDGVTGIVTTLDIQEIANALELLARDLNLRKRLGIDAQNFTLSNFGVERLVQDHEELYESLWLNRANS